VEVLGRTSPGLAKRNRLSMWVAPIAFAILMSSYIGVRTWPDRLNYVGGGAFRFQVAALGILLVGAVGVLLAGVRVSLVRSIVGNRLIWIPAIGLILAPLGIDPIDASLAALTAFIGIASVQIIIAGAPSADEFSRTMARRCTSILVFSLPILVVVNGVGSRRIGQIPANQLAKTALPALLLVLVFAETRRERFIGFSTATFLIVVTQSRGTALTAIAAILVAKIYQSSTSTINRIMPVVMVGVGLVLLAIALDMRAITDPISTGLLLDSETRGLGTGGSGRIDSVRAGVDLFFERPLSGHGLDSSTELARTAGYEEIHSGLVASAVELGVAGPLIIGSVVVALWRHSRKYSDRGLGRILAAVYLVQVVIEPVFLSLGSAAGLVFVVFISAGLSGTNIKIADRVNRTIPRTQPG